MLEPRKYKRSSMQDKIPTKLCENPNCGHKLPPHFVRKGRKYCDHICRREHMRLMAMEQRPGQYVCANCGVGLDPLSRSPSSWDNAEHHFCGLMCADEYRRKHDIYKQMSAMGNAEVKAYQKKHGKTHNQDERAQKVSENNKKAPPKSKIFDRSGKVWGYEVLFEGTGTDYIVSVPDVPELEPFHSPTKKGGLLEVRAKMIQIREEQRRSSARQ